MHDTSAFGFLMMAILPYQLSWYRKSKFLCFNSLSMQHHSFFTAQCKESWNKSAVIPVVRHRLRVGHFSGIAQHRLRKLINRFCKPIDIKLVFSTFKIKSFFNVKESLPDRLRACIVYKLSCASCNACYIGETSRHFSTRIHEHLPSDRSSHVWTHLQNSESCCATLPGRLFHSFRLCGYNVPS